MGPQLYRCGNTRTHWVQRTSRVRFNGAATLSLRKYPYRDWKNVESVRFNGAATLSLRKSGGTPMSMETQAEASMGPQLYRCGNQRIEYRPTLQEYCFNGAATLSLRKCILREDIKVHCRASMGPQLYRCGNRGKDPAERPGLHASMGPQLYRCGNQSLIDGLETPHTLLQWGRNFIVAEMGGV